MYFEFFQFVMLQNANQLLIVCLSIIFVIIASLHNHKYHSNKTYDSINNSDVTSLNITTLQAGVRVGDTFAYNCVPPVAKCTFDIRISPHVDPTEIGSMIDMWCQECSASPEDGHTVSWKGVMGNGDLAQKHALTKTDESNPWYKLFSDAMAGMGHRVESQVFPAATDSRFLRALNVQAFGFSPMRNTEIMLHENDEYLEESVFIEGVEVYVGLIEALGSATDLDTGVGL